MANSGCKTEAGKQAQLDGIHAYYDRVEADRRIRIAKAKERIGDYKKDYPYTCVALSLTKKKVLGLHPETCELFETKYIAYALEYDDPMDVPEGYHPIKLPDDIKEQGIMCRKYKLYVGRNQTDALLKDFQEHMFSNFQFELPR